jgi:subtilisin-like proprotein convertase family protein
VFHRRARIGRLRADGTVVLNPSFQISPNTPIAIGQDPVVNTTYMGDYDQIAGGPRVFLTTWSDNRLGNAFHSHQPDVRFAQFAANPAAADLSVSVTRSANPIGLGEHTVFTVTATALSGDATDVFLNMSPLRGLAIVSGTSASGQCTLIYQILGCSMGSIALGTSKSVEVVAAGTLKGNKRRLSVSATTSSRETATANNTANAAVTVTQGNAVTAVYSTGNIAVAIPDPGTVDVPITVSDLGTVVEVKAQVRLNHTFDADLDMFLIAPNGTTVELSTDNGGSGDNYGTGANDCSGTKTVFRDTAATPITTGSAPFAGSFRPEQSLQDLLGVPTDGVWRLRITDDTAIDSGIVGCVKLVITRLP